MSETQIREVGEFSLERALLDRVDELMKNSEQERVNNLKKLISIYSNIKSVVYSKYYPEIARLYPWYTDHGEKHVESIMMVLGEMLKQSFGRLNEMELFILLCSCVFHDTGMAKSRAHHEQEVLSIIQQINKLILDISVNRQINQIAGAHTSKTDLKELNMKDSCTFSGRKYSVSTRALAAMLRFADDISETRYRILPDLLEEGKVPKENEIYWQYAYIVESVEVSVVEMNCLIKMTIPKSILLKSLETSDGAEKIFFDYVLERIEKSNNERIMCSLEFRNIVMISELYIEINIMTDDLMITLDKRDIEANEEYCYRRSLKDSFFDKNPSWTIDELRKNYS